ncbi:ceramide kinase-like protein isoform X1, partial [Tachysurus ichikawai]
MFESLKNAINGPNACSESREELKEKKQPVSKSPALTGNRVTEKRKKRKKKQQQAQESEKRSVPEPRPLSPGETLSVHGRKETSGNDSKPIVRGIFQIGKKSHDVVLTSSRVTWTRIQPESPA